MTKQELEDLAQQLTNENEDLKLKLDAAYVEIEALNDMIPSPIESRKGSFSVAV